jgi:hypothetical protein
MRHLFLILTLLLTSCAPSPTTNQTNVSQPAPTQIPTNDLLYLPLDPGGPPEADPFLLVEATIIDAVTHQPVNADLYIVNAAAYREPNPSDLVLRNTQHFEIKLLAQSDSWFVVRAPGYEEWSLRLHYRLKTSRKLTGPVRLQRLPAEKVTLGTSGCTNGVLWTITCPNIL